MDNYPEERRLDYPRNWEDQYRNTGFVHQWRDKYSDLFEDYQGSTRLGTLDLFPQYALMFLLRRDKQIQSITWYKLASTPERSKNRVETLKHWDTMRRWMGQYNFRTIQDKLHQTGFKGFTGEPDLFCWEQDTERWFFAEAKGKDRLTETQIRWFHSCREALGDLADIRIYRLEPIPTRPLTTRWNTQRTRTDGPAMLRQKQERIEIRVPGKACEAAIPGRSLA